MGYVIGMTSGPPGGSSLPPAAIPGRVQYTTGTARFTKLKNIMCFKEVHEMIISGWAISEVARYVQIDRKEYTDVSADALMHVLTLYRAELPPGVLVSKAMPNAFSKAAEKVRKGVDELEELNKLYELQMKRIGIDFSTEKKINKLMPSMTNEIKEARNILSALAQLKMDLGLDERHIGRLDIEAGLSEELLAKYGKPGVSKVLRNPESRQKLLSLVEKFSQVQIERAKLAETGESDIDGAAGEGDFALKEMP